MILSYIDKNTFIHRLDPRTKIVLFFVSSLLAYLVKNSFALLGIFLLILMINIISLFPIKILLKGLIQWGIVIFCFSIVILLVDGYSLYPALPVSCVITARWLIVIQSAFLFMYSTNPQDLVLSLTKLNTPVLLAFSIGIGFRMVPAIIQKSRKILISQRCRGFDNRIKISTIGKLPSIFLPLVIPLLNYLQDFAERSDIVLDARGFDIYILRKTNYLSLKIIDTILISLCVLILIVAILYA